MTFTFTSFSFFKVFGLHWVFTAVKAFLQLRRAGATPHCCAQASHCGGFSCCGARALGTRASVVVVCRLNSCGTQA